MRPGSLVPGPPLGPRKKVMPRPFGVGGIAGLIDAASKDSDLSTDWPWARQQVRATRVIRMIAVSMCGSVAVVPLLVNLINRGCCQGPAVSEHSGLLDHPGSTNTG